MSFIKHLALTGILLSACVLPVPLEEEPEGEKTPPRFLREYCLPQFSVTAQIDSPDEISVHLVVEDPDIEDRIPFRVYKDYYLAPPGKKNSTLLQQDWIPTSTETQEDPEVRIMDFTLEISRICNSSLGDVTGSQHYIEVVVADGFSGSDDDPEWRATTSPPDVWGFFVICHQ